MAEKQAFLFQVSVSISDTNKFLFYFSFLFFSYMPEENELFGNGSSVNGKIEQNSSSLVGMMFALPFVWPRVKISYITLNKLFAF